MAFHRISENYPGEEGDDHEEQEDDEEEGSYTFSRTPERPKDKDGR